MTEATTALLDELARACVQHHPGEAALVLGALAPTEAVEALSAQTPAAAAIVLERMDAEHAAACLAKTSARVAAAMVAELDPARAAGLLVRLETSEREAIEAHLPEGRAEQIREVLDFPTGTVGRRMDARVALFPANTTVEDALRRLRSLAAKRIADLVVTDTEGRFAGVARLQDVAGAEATALLSTLADGNAPRVLPMTTEEEVVELLNETKVASLPVVDFEGRVLGILRQDELVAAARKDATADIAQMVGAGKEERALSTPWFAVKSRLPWLQINLLTAFLASAVVGLFEDTIAKFTALAILLPVVAGQSGNTGAQALAVTSRALALREIRGYHWPRVLAKEAATGLINGVSVGVVTSLSVYVWSGYNVGLAIVMLGAMVSAMLIASVAGAAIPIILAAMGRDPATASSIILTTVTDIFGFLSFLGLATLLAGLIAS
jgi:magnesium transporter